MDRLSKMNISNETQALNDTLNKMDLTDIYRTFYPKTTEYTFFSSAHGTFSRIDHILGHNQALEYLRKLKSYQVSFPMRLDINYRKKICKKIKTHGG